MNPSTPESSLPPLLLWGAGGHAKVVAEIVRAQGRYRVMGFLDDVHPNRYGQMFCQAPLYVGPDRLQELLATGLRHVLIAVGDNMTRLRLAQRAADRGLAFVIAVHPAAVIAGSALIGPGTVIAPLAVVNPDAQVGQHVIVNTAAVIEHDCFIGNGVHLSPRVTLGGGVSIGRGSWIGIGATVRDHVTIGSNTLIGAGATVVEDIPDNVVAFGMPARVQESKK